MKKVVSLLLAAMLMLGAVCASAEGKLVVYTPASDADVAIVIPAFEQLYDIEVEVITAGTGELLKRIEAEQNAPIADVLFSGAIDTIRPKADLFEPYVSPEEEFLYDQFKNAEGSITRYNTLPICLLVNTNLIGDITIEGYEDLLQPELTGKIAYTDVSASSCSFSHLLNMLYDMGGGDTDEGWAFVEAFCKNLDGRLLSSSSAVPRAVADGEYVVGLTHELYAVTYINSGAPVKAIYMEEGCVASPGTTQIVKGAPNMENAKLFIDYILSADLQTRYAQEGNSRSVRIGVPTPAGLPAMDEINVVEGFSVDEQTKAGFLERFSDLMDY